jgi:hypothetical protein
MSLFWVIFLIFISFVILITLLFFIEFFRSLANARKVIFPGGWDTFVMDPISFSLDSGLEMYAFELGGFSSPILGIWRGNGGLIIVPRIFVFEKKPCFSIGAVLRHYDLESLPDAIREKVEYFGLRPPYYVALTPFLTESISLDSLKLTYVSLDTEYKNQQRLISKMQDLLKQDLSAIKPILDAAGNAAHTFSGLGQKENDKK